MAPTAELEKLLEHVPNAICESLQETFQQMVMLPIALGGMQNKKNGNPTGCISGTIGLAGTNADGIELKAQISLIFNESLAKQIFRSMMMMGEDDPVEMEELQDVVGELANMTAGGAKTRLSEKNFLLSISLPTVAVGKGHYLGTPSGVKISEVIPVTLNDEIFYMELNLS